MFYDGADIIWALWSPKLAHKTSFWHLGLMAAEDASLNRETFVALRNC